MTIAAGSTKHVYDGNGVTRNWDFTFPIISDDGSDIELWKTDSEGTITEITANYTVDVAGAFVTYPTVASGLALLTDEEKITLVRVEPLSQATDWKNKGAFNSETVEAAIDKLTAIIQQLDEEVSRAIKYSVDEIPTSDDTEAFIATLEGLVAEAEDARDLAIVAKNSADADVVLSHADVVLTHADVVLTHADVVTAGLSKTAAELAETNAETAQTAAELAETHAETAETNAETAETNAESAQSAAEAAASTATTQAGLAATAKTNAETAETNAETAETNAETAQGLAETARDAAQNYAAGLKGTSTTSIAIGTGSKTFTTQAGKQFAVGGFVLIASDADPANYMHGQVTSYSSTSLVVNVTNVGGSGTLADWTITVSGSRGATGATGATGTIYIAAAGGTADAITADYSPDISLADKTLVAFVAAYANATATPTFAPDGLTAHTIVKKGGSALVAGDIPGAGAVCLVEYNLANTRWELLNPYNSADMKYADTRFSRVNTTHDVSVTGDQAITGVGFAPKMFFHISTIEGGTMWNLGWADSAGNKGGMHWSGAQGHNITSNVFDISPAGDATEAYENGALTWGADGVTIPWVKNGSPTGTLGMHLFFFR